MDNLNIRVQIIAEEGRTHGGRKWGKRGDKGWAYYYPDYDMSKVKLDGYSQVRDILKEDLKIIQE